MIDLDQLICDLIESKGSYDFITDAREVLKSLVKRQGYVCKNGKLKLLDDSEKKTSIYPKFKLNQWIVYNDNAEKVISVDEVNYHFDSGNVENISEVDSKSRLWTIWDASSGDVMTDIYGNIFVFSGIVKRTNDVEFIGCLSYLRSTTGEYIVKNKRSFAISKHVRPASLKEKKLLSDAAMKFSSLEHINDLLEPLNESEKNSILSLKFKPGDKIKRKDDVDDNIITIVSIDENEGCYVTDNEFCKKIPFQYEDKLEFVNNRNTTESRPFVIEMGKYYMCIRDYGEYFKEGNVYCSPSDWTLKSGGMVMDMSFWFGDRSDYFREATNEEVNYYIKGNFDLKPGQWYMCISEYEDLYRKDCTYLCAEKDNHELGLIADDSCNYSGWDREDMLKRHFRPLKFNEDFMTDKIVYSRMRPFKDSKNTYLKLWSDGKCIKDIVISNAEAENLKCFLNYMFKDSSNEEL